MRKNESAQIGVMFDKMLDLNHYHIDASERFLENLKGVSDPERKEKL